MLALPGCNISDLSVKMKRNATYLFVHDNVDLYTPLRRGLEHIINSVLLVLRRRSSQVKLWRKPPLNSQNIIL
jgi:hypothetical protein